MAKKNIKDLSIQVNLNGLSFCILNRSTNTIEYLNRLHFTSKLSAFDVLNRLKAELSSNKIFTDDFDDVLIIHQNELATMVPSELYNSTFKADYLKFNAKILRTDHIAEDEITVNKSINVYVPYVNVNNYIFETFGEFVFKHASSILVDSILQRHIKENGPCVYLNVNFNSLEYVVVNNKQLQLYNYFEFQTKEDLIYYILFVFEQLSLDTETTPVFLSGQINENDEYYNVIYKYVRHVSFMDFSHNFNASQSIYSDKLHEYYLILNSF